MNDKIYEMLNDVRMNEEVYDVQELPDIEKAKLKREFAKKIHEDTDHKSHTWRKIAAVVVVCLAFHSGTIYGKQFLSKKEKMSSIGSAYQLKQDMRNFEIPVNKSVKGKDSTVTLDSVVWDGTELLVMTTRTCEKEVGLGDQRWLGVDIRLDGEELQSDMSSSSYRLDDNNFKQIMRFGVVGKEDKEKIDTELCFYDIDDKGREQWKFQFQIENERFKKDSVRIPIKKTYEVAGQTIEIVEFTRNALGDKFLCRTKGEAESIKYLAIKGNDDQGNEVDFVPTDSTSYRGVEESSYLYSMNTEDSTIVFYPGLSLLEKGSISEDAKTVTLGLYVGEELDMNYDGYELVGETFTIDLKE